MSRSGHWIWPTTRAAIYRRDGSRCVYCAATEPLTLDHIKPTSRGGTHHPTNIITVCHSCNSSKQARSVRAFCKARGHNYHTVMSRMRRLRAKPIRRQHGS